MEAESEVPAAPSWSAVVERIVDEIRQAFGAPVAERVGLALMLHRDAGETALSPSIAEARDRTAELHAEAQRDRQEAEELVRDAVNSWRTARLEVDGFRRRMQEELEQESEELRLAAEASRTEAMKEAVNLRTEIDDLVAYLDDLRAPLDAREAELVAWEAELRRQAASLGKDWVPVDPAPLPPVPPTPTAGEPTGDEEGPDAETHDQTADEPVTAAQADTPEAPADDSGRIRSDWGARTLRPSSSAPRRSWGRRDDDGGSRPRSR